MRKITKVFLISGALFWSALAVGQTTSSTELLTEQHGVKMFVHHTVDASTGQPICQLEFYNTTNNPVTIDWKMEAKNGPEINFPEALKLMPGQMTSAKSFTGKDNAGINNQLNQIVESSNKTITINLTK